MFEREATPHDVRLAPTLRAVAGIGDARPTEAPAPGPERRLPDVGPGTLPLGGKGPASTPAELVATDEGGHRPVRRPIGSARPDAMAPPDPPSRPSPVARSPIVGDPLPHLPSSHSGFHLGRLPTRRRPDGLPEVA